MPPVGTTLTRDGVEYLLTRVERSAGHSEDNVVLMRTDNEDETTLYVSEFLGFLNDGIYVEDEARNI